MPKVSIIVPIYNSETYLRECLDSVFAQHFKDYELILVDDGSSDRSGEIVEEYASNDRRIITIHQENCGQSAARNAGLAMASAPYIYFLDCDDIMDPLLLETVIPEYDLGYELVVFQFRYLPAQKKLDAYNRPKKERQTITLNTEEQKYAFLAGPFRRRIIRWEVWNRIYRKDIIDKWNLSFPRDRNLYPEDMYFNYCYTAHISKILIIPDVLYTYRLHAESVSDNLKNHLMFLTSNKLASAVCEHYHLSEDCCYLYDHYLPLYYLQHKGALRRLRRYQWQHDLTMADAREIVKNNTEDYSTFLQIMTDAFFNQFVLRSYKEDRNVALQIIDRIYTDLLLEIPGSRPKKAAERMFLRVGHCYYILQKFRLVPVLHGIKKLFNKEWYGRI